MKIFVISLASLAFTLGGLTPAFAKRSNQLTESQLISKVEREYKKYGKTVSGLKPGCYSFEADVKQQSVTERELHSKKCGGDPATSPAIAHFDVKNGHVLIEDPVSGGTIPFDKNFKSDGP